MEHCSVGVAGVSGAEPLELRKGDRRIVEGALEEDLDAERRIDVTGAFEVLSGPLIGSCSFSHTETTFVYLHCASHYI